MQTISIKDICPTMEQAIRAMISGIITQIKRDDFSINMESFGGFVPFSTGEDMCYGCAATCTIQEIAHINLTSKDIANVHKRAAALNFNSLQLVSFEQAIDGMRSGYLTPLVQFYHEPQWAAILPDLLARMKNSGYRFSLENIDLAACLPCTPEQWMEHFIKILTPYEWLADQCKLLNL
jgi:hypothetical protein